MTTPSIRIIDSHTAGEPTRVIVEGAPDLGTGDMAARLAQMRSNADWLRTALVTEPRGSEWMVGAVLQKPVASDAAAGVVFFNNAGYLNMCGHGVIGLVATLAYLGEISLGVHRIETPVGDVTVRLDDEGMVAVENVPSYRLREKASVEVPEYRTVTGEIAWGGNWFFLAPTNIPVVLANVRELTRLAKAIAKALGEQGITGQDGTPIDHIELFGPPSDPAVADARNFVLCPGGEYDRSPCGTGTSAKLACLAAAGKLEVGQVWRQESILGTIFEGSYRANGATITPTIRGRAHVNADLRLVIDPDDPFRFGIPAAATAR